MTNFEITKKNLTIEKMTELLYLADNKDVWCTAYEKDGDIVCDKENCKNCIRKWLESEEKIIKKCAYCGAEFETTGYNQKFCTPSCGVKSRRKEHPPQKCVICGVEYIPWNSKQVTCGQKECVAENLKNKKAEKRAKRIPYNYTKPENERKPIRKKKKYTNSEWNKLTPSQRWELMPWIEVGAELDRLGIQYAEAQTLKQQGKLPEDFGKRGKQNV